MFKTLFLLQLLLVNIHTLMKLSIFALWDDSFLRELIGNTITTNVRGENYGPNDYLVRRPSLLILSIMCQYKPPHDFLDHQYIGILKMVYIDTRIICSMIYFHDTLVHSCQFLIMVIHYLLGEMGYYTFMGQCTSTKVLENIWAFQDLFQFNHTFLPKSTIIELSIQHQLS